jgi:hypothetical protein
MPNIWMSMTNTEPHNTPLCRRSALRTRPIKDRRKVSIPLHFAMRPAKLIDQRRRLRVRKHTQEHLSTPVDRRRRFFAPAWAVYDGHPVGATGLISTRFSAVGIARS